MSDKVRGFLFLTAIAGLLWFRPAGLAAQETEVKMVSEGEVTTTETETTKNGKSTESYTAKLGGEGQPIGLEEAGAEGEKEKPKGFTFDIPLKVDGLYTYLSDLQVSSIDQTRPEDEVLYPNNLGMNGIGGARFRLSPSFNFKDEFLIFAEADLLLYPFGDEPVGVERASDFRTHFGELRNWRSWFNPRQLYMEFHLPFGIVRAGQMGSYWGAGILANDGTHDPVFGVTFGGDLVERVLFATKPFFKLGNKYAKDLTVAIAGDLVYDDITAKLYKGDLAWQAVAALRWSYGDQAAGFYFVYRDQTKKDGRYLDVFVCDWYLNLSLTMIEVLKGYMEAEFAYLTGETTLAYSLTQPKGHDVSQFGASGRVGLKWLEAIDFWLELGYASGDSNSYDGKIQQFTMDPNHRVGMILFPEVLAWQSARTAVLAGSDDLSGEDNPGIELLPSNGGVAGAFYFNPVLRGRPLKWLELNAGFVFARTSAYLVSAWEQKNRGRAANFLGGSVIRRNLGVEFDGSAWFHIPVKYVGLGLGVEFGYFWPGDYFVDAAGHEMDDVWLISGRLRFTY
jgi:hypothetical protein